MTRGIAPYTRPNGNATATNPTALVDAWLSGPLPPFGKSQMPKRRSMFVCASSIGSEAHSLACKSLISILRRECRRWNMAEVLLGERNGLLSALGELALAWRLAGGTVELSLEPRPVRTSWFARFVNRAQRDLVDAPPSPTPSGSTPDSASRSARDERAAAKAALSTTVERYRTVLRAMMCRSDGPRRSRVRLI